MTPSDSKSTQAPVLRRSDERGRANHGWLDARHSFSFAGYHDPAHMGFRTLRVLNEDRIAPEGGFPTHPHRDMEILTYVIEGSLEHKDSMGNGSLIQAGEFQRMTAGTGVQHSEFNASSSDGLHLLQIWIVPAERGLAPGYEQKRFDDRTNALRLVAGPDGSEGALTIHQDARVYSTLLEKGSSVEHRLAESRHAWIQVLRGAVMVNGQALEAGDALASSEPGSLTIAATDDAELLLFDLS